MTRASADAPAWSRLVRAVAPSGATPGVRVLDAGLLVLVVALAVVSSSGLAPPAWEGPVAVAVFVAAVALAAVRCVAGPRRVDDVLLTLALLGYAASWAYRVLVYETGIDTSYPSPMDAMWLTFPLLAAPAIALHGRARGDRSRPAMWVDVLIGAAGTAAAVSTFFMVSGTRSGTTALAVLNEAAYVVGDTALVAVCLQAAFARRFRVAPSLWLRMAGAVTLVAGDALYVAAAAGGRPDDLGWSGATWPVGVVLLALSVGRATEDLPQRTVRREVLLVPVVGSVTSVLVLLTTRDDRVIRLLAAAAILLAVGRMALAFREVDALAGSRELARTDELTGLANRRAFYDEATRVLATGRPATVLLLDLDGFKEVNDSLGHGAGDALLALVARRLAAEARRGGGGREGDVVARLGGDEFAALLPGATPETGARAVERMVGALTASYEIDGVRVRVSAAAGVVHAPEHGTTTEELVRCADVAMYASKAARSGVVVYDASLDTRSRTGLQRVERLRTALRDGGVVVHFQPKVDLRTGAVTGVEALARLQDPDEGLLYPGQFLGLLAQAGELPRLTELVLDAALAQARRWRDDGRPLPVAVNVPADAVVDEGLPERLDAILERHGLDGSSLVVEVTEELLLHDHVTGRAVLGELRSRGIRVSIDDYGTGYSSLAYLRDLPLDELKLDRSFAEALAGDPRAERIVESTAALAHSLGLRIVAEGIETESERELVARCGCDEAQGYLFARPAPAEQLAELLAERCPVRLGRGGGGERAGVRADDGGFVVA
ncbi:putative bifunctional diguanylate cyclase/phosphodiesterase [Cellulomonas carbonis]|uniref:Diguanylate cyclase n=1 Tax=Cellulomonas carbonis T26 TaxID=947969 RepID=A0A0A0BQ90_9CELL|nr:bifunctional diguanylate cyclase/phosphodiesterase [Cellulomonas carbonis]KGM09812.1 diguanylate cyclase [Cellulomonas carbonis T26]GGC01820.1 GGDEF-domain containing protein [Cellulomonas carbonis]